MQIIRRLPSVAATLCLFFLSDAFAEAAEPCSFEMVIRILSPATASDPSVRVNCDLRLPPNAVVTKQLVFFGARASGVRVNCNGAILEGGRGEINFRKDMILVLSNRRSDTRWERPENIRIENCTVHGSVRLIGMGANGEALHVGKSSRCEGPFDFDRDCRGHTRRAQDAAPTGIVLSNMRIIGVGRNPVYFAPGATGNMLVDSVVTGVSDAVGVYLDAESAHNIIRNNFIHVSTADRKSTPQLAVDGSAYNIIAGNRFSALDHGGIYLYRNCGEAGTVRHQTPQYNRIINNIFYYNKYKGKNPSVWLASRNGGRSYCNRDDAYPFGSGASDRDFARHNIVADNRIIKRESSQMVRADERPNEFFNNVTVASATRRPSNCYEFDTLPVAFMRDGERSSVSSSGDTIGCRLAQKICRDGAIVNRFTLCPLFTSYVAVDFECGRSASNSGAQCEASCPRGYRIFSAKAACNLENNVISRGDIVSQGWATLTVQRASDNIASGVCQIGPNSASVNTSRIPGITGTPSVRLFCREHDKNGGDCNISGTLACISTLFSGFFSGAITEP